MITNGNADRSRRSSPLREPFAIYVSANMNNKIIVLKGLFVRRPTKSEMFVCLFVFVCLDKFTLLRRQYEGVTGLYKGAKHPKSNVFTFSTLVLSIY